MIPDGLSICAKYNNDGHYPQITDMPLLCLCNICHQGTIDKWLVSKEEQYIMLTTSKFSSLLLCDCSLVQFRSEDVTSNCSSAIWFNLSQSANQSPTIHLCYNPCTKRFSFCSLTSSRRQKSTVTELELIFKKSLVKFFFYDLMHQRNLKYFCEKYCHCISKWWGM